MKICIASDQKQVTQHFGHCQSYEIYTIDNQSVVNHQTIVNPGHKPGYLPGYLAELGINLMISGGMGGAAIDLFHEQGIDVMTGVSGSCDNVIERYLSNDLNASYSPCEEHSHH